MKWVLVLNTTAPKGNYHALIVVLIAILITLIGTKVGVAMVKRSLIAND